MVFAKGNVPWNKGKRYSLKHEGQFKKGQAPWNKGTKGLMSKTKPDSFKEHRRKAWLGKNNPMWKGEEGSYSAKHKWLSLHYKKKGVCEHCKKEKPTQWANISKQYLRKRGDYLELCKSCHNRHDRTS